jgi:hypothetical protein
VYRTHSNPPHWGTANAVEIVALKNTLEPLKTTAFNGIAETRPIENSYFQSIATHFNKPPNLARDQGAGGSNTLSPAANAAKLKNQNFAKLTMTSRCPAMGCPFLVAGKNL